MKRLELKKLLQSCPVLDRKVWTAEDVLVAADWAMERGWEKAEAWDSYRGHKYDHDGKTRDVTIEHIRRAVAAGVDVNDPWVQLYNSDSAEARVNAATGNVVLEVSSETGEEGEEDEDGFAEKIFDVYEIECENQKVVDAEGKQVPVAKWLEQTGDDAYYIVPVNYRPDWYPSSYDRRIDFPREPVPQAYVEWFIRDLGDVANSCDQPTFELVKALCGDNPAALAMVYEEIAYHHGHDNFDAYPMRMTESELIERWNRYNMYTEIGD